MYDSLLAQIMYFALWFVAAGFLLHVICSAIIDRVTTRSDWPPLGDNNKNDLTNDTGPK